MFILQVATLKKNHTNKDLRVGGPETSVINLSKALSKMHKVIIYNLSSERNISIQGVQFFNKFGFLKFLKTHSKPDLVLIHEVYNFKIIPIILVCRLKKIKVYIFPRGVFSPIAISINRYKKFIYYKFIFSFLVRMIEGFIVLNEGEKKITKNLYPNIPTKVIPNGSTLIYNKNQIFKIKNNKTSFSNLNIGYLGRFDFYIKGLDKLLNEYQLYINESKIRKCKLIFVGEHRNRMGFCSKTLISQFNKKNPKNKILLRGPYYGNQKIKEMLKFDVLILPSRSEGMPNTILEAMSLGIPVIVTPQTNISKIVKKSQCGWVVNHDKHNIKNLLIDLDRIKKNDLLKKNYNAYNFFQKKLTWDIIVKKSFLNKTIINYKY